MQRSVNSRRLLKISSMENRVSQERGETTVAGANSVPGISDAFEALNI
jgi:hypothetical protein